MLSTPLGNRDLIRAINRSIILNVIKTEGMVARAEVARRTGLSPATVTGITADLIAEGLVFEKEPGDSSGGRRPIMLAINPDGGYVAGIKLMEDQAVGALTDLESRVLCKETIPLDSREPGAVVAALGDLVELLVARASAARTLLVGFSPRLLGVGVGLAGIVDSERGVLRQTPFQKWHNLPMRDLLQARIAVPVYIDNDVNTLTLAEQLFGSGQGLEDFLVITVGRGVGLGMVFNRQFYRGARGGAGEFGHTVIDPRGAQCDCGKRGCLETYVGDPGLLRAAGELISPAPDSTAALLALAESGDERARGVFAHAGEILGGAVANLINVLNPQRIIISGEGAVYGRWMFDALLVAVDAHATPALRSDVVIKVEPLGDDAWACGAASLVLRELFEHPARKEMVLAAE